MITAQNHQPALEVAQVLGAYGTPLFVDTIVRAQVILAGCAYEELDFELVNLIMSSQHTMEGALLSEANIIVRRHVAGILKQNGVELDEDGDLSSILDILETVLEAPSWYNTDDLELVLAMDCSEEERLIELARIIKNPKNQYYDTLVEKVDVNFAKRLKDIMLDGFHVEDDERSLDEEHVAEVRAYKAFVQDAICFKLLNLGYQVGSSAESYLRRASSLIASRNNKEGAREVVGFLIFSRDGWRSPLKTWDDVNAVLNMELDDLALLGVEVRKMMADFDTYKVKTK